MVNKRKNFFPDREEGVGVKWKTKEKRQTLRYGRLEGKGGPPIDLTLGDGINGKSSPGRDLVSGQQCK